jgi:hypothetical protein
MPLERTLVVAAAVVAAPRLPLHLLLNGGVLLVACAVRGLLAAPTRKAQLALLVLLVLLRCRSGTGWSGAREHGRRGCDTTEQEVWADEQRTPR